MRLWSWLRAVVCFIFDRRYIESDMEEEFRSHLKIRAADLERQGLSQTEAERQARIEFGCYQRYKEECREALGTRLLQELAADLRYGVRQLRRNPGFTAVAIITLTLGIGANTAIFSVVNAVLIEPLPFHDPGRLVELWAGENAPGTFPLSGPDYLAWRSQNHTLAATSIYSPPEREDLGHSGGAVPAAVTRTQGNFFLTLGVQALLGRTFAKGEDIAGHNRVAVLTYSIWQQQFAGRRGIVGKTIKLNNRSFTVIGVLPRWFTFDIGADIYAPLDMSPSNLGPRGTRQWRVIARLKPGVTAAQAAADLTGIEERRGKLYPDDAGVKAVVLPFQQAVTHNARGELWVLLAAVALILLIACANIAGLMLARATSRSHEMALRSALGAGRARLIRQLLTESVTVALAGGAAGLGAAWWTVRYIQAVRPLPIPRLHPITVDLHVLVFAFAVSLFVGLLFGLAPALQASDTRLVDELRSASQTVLGSSTGRQMLRDGLVAAEIALSLILLIGAGLLLRTFVAMRDADIGVECQGLLTMGFSLPKAQYPTATARRSFLDGLLSKVRQTPGVSFAAVSSEIPLEGGFNGYITVPGNNNPAYSKQLVEWNFISKDYFRTYGIPVFRGRGFTPEDMQNAVVTGAKLWALYTAAHGNLNTIPPGLIFPAIINRTMARTFWHGQDPIGKVFENPGRLRIVGLVGDAKEARSITARTGPQAYFPFTALLGLETPNKLAIRTSLAPLSLVSAIRHDFASLDSSLAVYDVRTMQQVVNDHMRQTSLQTLLLGLFATLALFLAASGIYGVMTYLVVRRTREFGIRMALGAQKGDVLRMVVGQGLKLALIGVAIGIGGALALTRFLASLLYGVKPTDPITFTAVSLLLIAVALLACYIPARRAAKVDPMKALRCE